MTRELKQTLVDHAAGNYRVFITMAGELLMSAAQRGLEFRWKSGQTGILG